MRSINSEEFSSRIWEEQNLNEVPHTFLIVSFWTHQTKDVSCLFFWSAAVIFQDGSDLIRSVCSRWFWNVLWLASVLVSVTVRIFRMNINNNNDKSRLRLTVTSLAGVGDVEMFVDVGCLFYCVYYWRLGLIVFWIWTCEHAEKRTNATMLVLRSSVWPEDELRNQMQVNGELSIMGAIVVPPVLFIFLHQEKWRKTSQHATVKQMFSCKNKAGDLVLVPEVKNASTRV